MGTAFDVNVAATESRAEPCPLLGVKRTSSGRASMSAYDPKRTLAVLHFRSAAQVSDDVLDVRRREGNAHELAGTAVA